MLPSLTLVSGVTPLWWFHFTWPLTSSLISQSSKSENFSSGGFESHLHYMDLSRLNKDYYVDATPSSTIFYSYMLDKGTKHVTILATSTSPVCGYLSVQDTQVATRYLTNQIHRVFIFKITQTPHYLSVPCYGHIPQCGELWDVPIIYQAGSNHHRDFSKL